ncbi:type IV toxin-antitoxin system AbiEi family antitoxin domain-containing protein [Nocardioides sp. Soil805]|uniref:type IV toxin-antitoxin system AbiEi family antitoxin domain-containing protein n=1 Tax=Nocardioides sp. Soil805 TaxID=1736416 RepID=UPI000703392C|nr:type IV toxin-antitoxin system AbiEi family antitoxin domain-containing protein [Nocardioides sp. Soil805]KRF32347.1 hypothetical protein ASG94_17920 [Nocardioides sp. Soil805]
MYDDFPVRLADIDLRRDLVADGWTDRDIAYAVRSGELVKVRYGAYVRASLVRELDPVAHMRVRSRAVLRTAHPTSVVTNHNALAEHGVALWGVDLTETHLARTDGRSGRREAGIVHHRAGVDDDDWTLLHGIPVMRPARAALEVLLTHTAEVGLVAACGVLTRNLTSSDDLRAAADAAERWPNSLTARLVLSRADAALTSVAEARTWHFFHEQRIPRPTPQVTVHDEHGEIAGIVDFLWREHGIFLEFDGKIKYTTFRRPGETLDQYLMREKKREERICLLTGWVCIRITWADLENPLRTARRIVQLLESRARRGA